jgi:hypothetical protein
VAIPRERNMNDNVTISTFQLFQPTGRSRDLPRRKSARKRRRNLSAGSHLYNSQPMDHGSYDNIPADRPNAYHWRAGHFAVGWVEYLMIRADAPDELRTRAGEMLLCNLADYAVLDDDRWSKAEHEAVCAYWAQCSVKERVEYLQEADISIFAARRDELPQDDDGALYQRLASGL